jgi:tetratricopeptide (TPR) repeat protein
MTSISSTSLEDPLPSMDDLWNYRDPAGTEAKFRDLLPRLSDRQLVLELKTQIARTYSLRGMFEEAHATLDEVTPFLTEARPVVKVRYLLERGRSFNSAERQAEAVPLFTEALEIARQEGLDYHAVDAAHMLAIAVPLDDQLGWNQVAMEMAEESEDTHTRSWLGALYNNMGWTLHDSGEYEQALIVFKKGVAFREEQGEEISLRIARWTVARTMRSLGRYDEALAIQLALEQEWAQADDEDGYVFEEIGECLLALGRTSEARIYFARAHAVLRQDSWLAEHEQERLGRLETLGQEG